jgi:hypothetical protein
MLYSTSRKFPELVRIWLIPVGTQISEIHSDIETTSKCTGTVIAVYVMELEVEVDR